MLQTSSLLSDLKYKDKLLPIVSRNDIPEEWLDSPISKYIAAENFREAITPSGKPELLLVHCIEFRYALPVPSNYAYVIRRASGRVIGSEFSLGYVLSKGVRHMIMLAHDDCGMTKVDANKQAMIDSLVEQGWYRECAEEYISYQAQRHAIKDEIEAQKKEYYRLKRIFKRLWIAPLFVSLAEQSLYLPKWYKEAPEQVRLLSESGVAEQDLLHLF
jgi:carbonic anhydrase